MNSFSVEMLFEDFGQQLLRDLGSQLTGAGTFVGGDAGGAMTVRIVGDVIGDTKPKLLTEWIRLPSWRQIPSTITASTYKITTHRATSTVSGGDAAGAGVVNFLATRAGVPAQAKCLLSVGRSRVAAIDGARSAPMALGSTAYLDVTFAAIQSAMIPSYLFIVLQKSSKMFTQDGYFASRISDWSGTVGALTGAHVVRAEAGLENYLYSRNQDANAQISDIELFIQSSIGAYTYSAEGYPYTRRARELWTDHCKNVCDGYCANDMVQWQKNNCCLLLRASDYARGLGSPNSAMPVQITCKVRFQNTREQIDGHAAVSQSKQGIAVLRDFIAGTPCMAQIFDSNSLTIASSSAVQSSASLSHSTALDILSRQ
jgi:hypothetical protein